MDSYSGYKNRRSDSQLLPRLFLALEVVIMALVSYILFTILSALSISQTPITIILVVINAYAFNKVFFKCREISKRNAFTKKYQTN